MKMLLSHFLKIAKASQLIVQGIVADLILGYNQAWIQLLPRTGLHSLAKKNETSHLEIIALRSKLYMFSSFQVKKTIVVVMYKDPTRKTYLSTCCVWLLVWRLSEA